MSSTAPVRQRAARLLVMITAALVTMGGSPASAAPAVDPDGGTGTLQQQLTVAARAYTDTKAKLDASRQRQVTLGEQLRVTEADLAIVAADVSSAVAAAYRGRRNAAMTMVLTSDSQADGFLHSAATIGYLTWRDDQALHRLTVAKRQFSEQQQALTDEIKETEKQFAEIAKRRADLDRALGNSSPTGGFSGGAPSATPSPRNADGSWPRESCSVPDPTVSGGCLTPRTLHTLQQARAAGFTHYTACFRSGGGGEHPLGRACDFAAAPNGFGGVATGDDKIYGDRLAAWALANADRLGVLYVIWYKQIWMSGTGWRSYTGDGTPAGDHYNHVHLSIY